jgi:hypothetical protein
MVWFRSTGSRASSGIHQLAEPYAGRRVLKFVPCYTTVTVSVQRGKRLEHRVFSPQSIVLNSALIFGGFHANVNKGVFNSHRRFVQSFVFARFLTFDF